MFFDTSYKVFTNPKDFPDSERELVVKSVECHLLVQKNECCGTVIPVGDICYQVPVDILIDSSSVNCGLGWMNNGGEGQFKSLCYLGF